MKTILSIFLFISFTTTQTEFYRVISNNSLVEINETIVSLEAKSTKTVIDKAYLSALKMKKSHFEKDLKKKIELFKHGATSLEKLIEANPNNVELRFIRLIIQENAPRILKYNSELNKDADFIVQNIENINKDIKKEIQNYSEVSKYLNL